MTGRRKTAFLLADLTVRYLVFPDSNYGASRKRPPAVFIDLLSTMPDTKFLGEKK